MKKVAHRDVKPNNIMIKLPEEQTGDELRWPQVKIFDFSFACDIRGIESMTTIGGNPHWMAPELLGADGKYTTNQRHNYHLDIDIYSLGLIFAFACMNEAGRKMIGHTICKWIYSYILQKYFYIPSMSLK